MADRAANGGGKATDILPGFIQRAVEGVRYVIEGVTPSTFFGPSQPLPAQSQDSAGRQFDYPVGININTQPRSTEGVSFGQLRALADNLDILRIVIETRKDQLCRMKWKFQAKDKATAKKDDPRLKTLEEFFAYPDRVNDWSTWLRMVLEDLFVIDAPTVYVRKNRGGVVVPSRPFALEIIDGATITPKLNADGRRPDPPSPAFQQILKGIPAVDYTRDELLYLPRNLRSWKIYGFSPVEQILMTVNIALRRQIHQLEFYTDGNVPDLLIKVPETWQAEQIKQYQLFWDTLTGTATRRKARFIPSGAEPYDTKAKELKDAFDEWLARIVCFCFSIPPQPFVKEVNRATAETAAGTAKEEGLEPSLQWIKSLLDRVIVQVFGWSDLEASWGTEKELDPKTQAEIDDLDVKNGAATINEVRKNRGRDPVEGGDEPMIYTAAGPTLLRDVLDPPEPPPAPTLAPGSPAAPAPPSPSNEGGKQEEADEGAPAKKGKAADTDRIMRLAEAVPPVDNETAGAYLARLRQISEVFGDSLPGVERVKKKGRNRSTDGGPLY